MIPDLFEAMNLPEVKGMKKFYPTTNLYSYERNDNVSYKLNESNDDELPEDEMTDEEEDEIDEDNISDDEEIDIIEGGYIEIEDDEDEEDEDKVI